MSYFVCYVVEIHPGNYISSILDRAGTSILNTKEYLCITPFMEVVDELNKKVVLIGKMLVFLRRIIQ